LNKFRIRKEDCLLLGVLIKKYGNKGGFILKSEKYIPDNIAGLKSVFLEIDGQLVPFFIEEDGIDIRSDNTAVIIFDDILSEPRIRKMLDSNIYITASQGEVSAETEYSGIEGFEVIDNTHGNIGKIDSVMNIPGNPVLKITKGNKEIMIPVTASIIRLIDEKTRKVEITAPEGLIELYL